MTDGKTSQHNIVFEHGYEYDEEGHVCGEWGREVCSKCGAEMGFMNSPAECPVEDN